MLAGAALLALGFYVGYRLEISSTLADRTRLPRRVIETLRKQGRTDEEIEAAVEYNNRMRGSR